MCFREIYNSLYQFFLTYDKTGKSVIDIFNDFEAATRIKISGDKLQKILEEIQRLKDLDFDAIVLAAENAGVIPCIIYQLKEYKNE